VTPEGAGHEGPALGLPRGTEQEPFVSDRRTSPPRGADGRGVPPVARARFAAELHEELARARLAWAAATLRGDAARQAGDRAGAERALDEQRTLLRDLHDHVDGVVGRALLEREVAAIVTAPSEPPAAERGPVGDRVGRRSVRGRVGTALGAVVAAVAGALFVAAPQAPPAPTVAPLAADADADDADDAADRVTVAGERVQPLDVAVARLSAVLVELGTRLRDAPEGASGPDASATSDRDDGAHRTTSPARDDPGEHATGTPGEAELSPGTVDDDPAEGDGPARREEGRDLRVDVPTRTDEVVDTLDEPIGSVPDDEPPAPTLRLELPTRPDDGGHLSVRSATG
jgi:hypothetical protein